MEDILDVQLTAAKAPSGDTTNSNEPSYNLGSTDFAAFVILTFQNGVKGAGSLGLLPGRACGLIKMRPSRCDIVEGFALNASKPLS